MRKSLRKHVEWRGQMLTVMNIPEQGCGVAARSPRILSKPSVSDKTESQAVFPQPSSPANLR